MDGDERARLRRELEIAGDSSDEVRALFRALVDRLGVSEASATWWAVFAATDASET